jgi:hypothetical protein
MRMLHYFSFAVVEINQGAKFYHHVLAEIGSVWVFADLRLGQEGQAIGYGLALDGDKFCIKKALLSSATSGHGFHLAFAALNRMAVHEFHKQALLHEGQRQRKPGPSPRLRV